MREQPEISCICATQQDLKLPIHCFWQQTMPERSLEMIVIHPRVDWPELAARERDDSRIRSVTVEESVLKAGASRYNAGIAAAKGKYFAIWDSDDWHAPERLQRQLEFIDRYKSRGSLLGHIGLYDRLSEAAYRSEFRAWEGTLLLEKAVFPGYPTTVVKGADTQLVSRIGSNLLYILRDDKPLYIYSFHNSNFHNRQHAELLFLGGTPWERKEEFRNRFLEGEERFS